MRSSLSGLNLAVQFLRYSPAELKKYGPSLRIQNLSSRHRNITVKNPFGPSCSEIWPLGFHFAAIQPYSAFFVGQNPMNFPMSAWSVMYWILSLIFWLGSSIFGLSTAIGLHVLEVTLIGSSGLSVPSGISLRLSDWLAGASGCSCSGLPRFSAVLCRVPNISASVCPGSKGLDWGEGVEALPC